MKVQCTKEWKKKEEKKKKGNIVEKSDKFKEKRV